MRLVEYPGEIFRYIKKCMEYLNDARKINRLVRNMDGDYIDQLTYKSLKGYYLFQTKIPGGKERYRIVSEKIFNANIKKIKDKKIIKVAIIANYSSTFCCDEIFKMLLDDDRYDPYIIVAPNHNYISGGWMIDDYINTLNELQNKYGERVKGALVENTSIQCGWEKLNVEPDLIFNLTPYELLKGPYLIQNYPLNVLNIYIPYGYLVADNIQHSFVYTQFNLVSHNLMWKIYATSQMDLINAEKYAFLGSFRWKYSGYPKMDHYFENVQIDENKIWKGLDNHDLHIKKKIVFAPHHSLRPEDGVTLSTFDQNKDFMLALAKRRQDISWIFRPHPQLGMKAIKYGVFKDYKEFDLYLKEWNSLPNARVSLEGEYTDIFKSSDAMIMDCASFLAEYLFVNKPLLFLMNPKGRFNESGKKCLEAYATISGDSFFEIERFVDDVVLDKDSQKKKREEIFDENFNYYKKNGRSASKFIIEDLNSFFDN